MNVFIFMIIFRNNFQELGNMLNTNDLIEYPNVTTALRMFLCTFGTNCLSEHSFSALKRVKSYLCLSMESDRFNVTSILYTKSEMFHGIKYKL